MCISKFNPWGVTLLALLATGLVEAKTVILDCFTVMESNPEYEFSVELDEEEGTVRHVDAYTAFMADALYNPQQISYQQLNPEGFGLMRFRQYIINRETLGVTEFVTIKGTATQKSRTTTALGSCLLKESRR